MLAVQQGAFDGLCGVYSVINALDQVGLTGPRRTLHRDLFRNIVMGIPPKVLRNAIIYGLETEQLMTASRRGLRWLRSTHGIDIRISPWRRQAQDKIEFISALSMSSRQPGQAIILCFSKPGLQHWSVISKMNNRKITLRDSGGLKQLELDRFDLDHGRYRLLVEDTLIVRRLKRPSAA